MGYEVDSLRVGHEGTSGDAIPLRYGDLHGDRSLQFVAVVDGGFKETGPDVVDFVQKRYQTSIVDLAICTHPDRDHAPGLTVVLEELDVRALWMHKPWDHAAEVSALLDDGRSKPESVCRRLRQEFPHAVELAEIAERKGIPVEEPFQGLKTADGVLTLLGPTRSYYVALLVEVLGGACAEPQARVGLLDRIVATARRAIRRVREEWDDERLEEPAPTDVTPINRSCAIVWFDHEGHTVHFTADAGVPSLERAADYADQMGIDLRGAGLIQVPHHGSKRNVGPSLLDRLVGPVLAEGESISKSAFISAAKDGTPTHPSGRVINAFVRRGARISATQGRCIWHYHDAPDRPDYSPLTPIPFQHEYDEEQDA